MANNITIIYDKKQEYEQLKSPQKGIDTANVSDDVRFCP
jgi:hypothetical protein